MNPKTAHAPLQLPPWGHSPQLSSIRDPCCHQHLCPWGLCCSSQALQSSAHLSSCIYFCKTSYVHSHFCSTGGPGLLQHCEFEARIGSALVFAKQELCFCQVLSLGCSGHTSDFSSLLSPSFLLQMTLLLWREKDKIPYIPSCLSAFLMAFFSFPCTRHKQVLWFVLLPLITYCLFLPVTPFSFPLILKFLTCL